MNYKRLHSTKGKKPIKLEFKSNTRVTQVDGKIFLSKANDQLPTAKSSRVSTAKAPRAPPESVRVMSPKSSIGRLQKRL